LHIVSGMAQDETSHFRPRAGRIRHGGARSSGWPRSFFDQVMAAVAKENGGRLSSSQFASGRRSRSVGKRPKKGRCCRIGRGQAVADRLKRAAVDRRSGERRRRVVVKARITHVKLGSRAADAHIRYLQRDGTTRNGERGRLYAAKADGADGDAFTKRGREDRHQFRFIGRFAMIDNGLGFSLVPWRPVLENKIGREVMGMMRGQDISWEFSRARTLGIGI
jgi:hypothetical protein